MTNEEIIRGRLVNQRLLDSTIKKPEDVVKWLTAMQAQEFAHARWAVGLRMTSATDESVEKAFNAGKILRTHLMRPTWHFVAPQDIRWMLALTAPQVNQLSAYMHRKTELDSKTFIKSEAVLLKALKGGQHLTRVELEEQLEKAKIQAKELRMGYILMHAELEGLICSGPRVGKQFTYALLDERVGSKFPVKPFLRGEALAELALRYFVSRGPATVKDFSTWSGLSVRDAAAGAGSLPKIFIRERSGKLDYIFHPDTIMKSKKISLDHRQATFLMPDYDEYGMSYKDRSAIHDPKTNWFFRFDKSGFNHMIVVEGVIRATWRRTVGKEVLAETRPLGPLTKVRIRSIERAVRDYYKFLGQ